jgi:hypothetical protein
MFQDLRVGIRMLRRSPGFSILAVLCLTLGIAATTSVFSWIEGILLRPFPLVARQDRMFCPDRNRQRWPHRCFVARPSRQKLHAGGSLHC